MMSEVSDLGDDLIEDRSNTSKSGKSEFPALFLIFVFSLSL